MFDNFARFGGAGARPALVTPYGVTMVRPNEYAAFGPIAAAARYRYDPRAFAINNPRYRHRQAGS